MRADQLRVRDADGRQHVVRPVPGGFHVDGRAVTLVAPRPTAAAATPTRTASGSVAGPTAPARVARASRVLVEGIHDAELVEKVWGDDLRGEGVVVEPLHGADDLAAVVRGFGPRPGRRLGILLDHLVDGSKETRLAAGVDHPDVLVTGHPFVDVWQAVRPAALGIPAWPTVPRGTPWKEGVIAALGSDRGPRCLLAAGARCGGRLDRPRGPPHRRGRGPHRLRHRAPRHLTGPSLPNRPPCRRPGDADPDHVTARGVEGRPGRGRRRVRAWIGPSPSGGWPGSVSG